MTPHRDVGGLTDKFVQENVLHDGSCTTLVNGRPSWVDTYDFQLDQTTAVQIDMVNLGGLDPYLKLLTAAGAEIATDDDSGDGTNARITQTLSAGAYRIEATQYNVHAGDYRLTINVDPRSTSPSSSSPVRSLDAGAQHTCALLADGRLRCWGRNEHGQSNARPGTFASVSAGRNHTCAIDTTEALRCWGGTFGIDGHPSIPVSPRGSFTQVSAAHFASTCAVTTSGEVRCWGFDNWGQATAPAGRFTQVSAAAFHACALAATGTVECWGHPDNRSDLPTGTFTQISASMFYTCALRTSGEVQCWGDDVASGQTNPPAGRFTQVDAGVSQACALTTGDEIRCWGSDSEPPTGRFSQVAVGAYHACALRQDGAVECWGSNARGQLDVPEDLATPVAAVAGCPEPTQLFRVTETTSTSSVSLTRPARLDTDCQVDGLPGGRVRPADRYGFTLDRPAHVSAKLVSDEFAPYLFLTDADGQYHYLAGTDAEGGTWLSLSGSRAANGDGNAIITQVDGAVGGLQPATFGLRLEPGTYWLFAVSASGSRTGDYRLEVDYARIGDSGLDQQIAERFAPVLLFEQDEEYFPVPVEHMIQFSTLRYTANGQAASKAPGTYGLADLLSHNGQESYLDLADWVWKSGRPGDRVVYARVMEVDDLGVLVQYWFFYLNNKTGIGAASHEGDWEGIQLWFAGANRESVLNAFVPDWMGYAAHEGGWAFRQDAESCAGASGVLYPSVYVARNRHASYIEAGGGGPIAQLAQSIYGTSLDKSFGDDDQFQGDGATWALHGRDVPGVAGELGYEIRIMPRALGQSWLAWDGRWGEVRDGYLGIIDVDKDGPQGPAFKEHFWLIPELLPVFKDGWDELTFGCRPR